MQQCISDHSVHENPGALCENADSDSSSLWRGLRRCFSSRLLGDADQVSADPTEEPQFASRFRKGGCLDSPVSLS